VAGKIADRVEESGQKPHDIVKGAFMDLKRKIFPMLTAGIFSGWLLTFLTVQNAWCMSGCETYWHSALAKGKAGEDFTSPKDFPGTNPLKRFQPQERDQKVPIIAPPITDSEMVKSPPVTDPEMIVTPKQTEPIGEETIQKESTQKMPP